MPCVFVISRRAPEISSAPNSTIFNLGSDYLTWNRDSLVAADISLGLQQQFPSHQVKHYRQKQKWNQAQQIRIRPFEEGIMMCCPLFINLEFVHYPFPEIQKRVDHTSQRSSGNVARGEEHTRTLVCFRSHFLFTQLDILRLFAKVFIDQPAHSSAHKNRSRSGDW